MDLPLNKHLLILLLNKNFSINVRGVQIDTNVQFTKIFLGLVNFGMRPGITLQAAFSHGLVKIRSIMLNCCVNKTPSQISQSMFSQNKYVNF